MKLSLTIATLSTLLLSAVVHASLRGNNKAENYFALIGAGAQVDEEITGCMASALGHVIAMVRDDRFCIKLSCDGLSSPELFSHAVHGPAAFGETVEDC
jgi:hypothetical protein